MNDKDGSLLDLELMEGFRNTYTGMNKMEVTVLVQSERLPDVNHIGEF